MKKAMVVAIAVISLVSITLVSSVSWANDPDDTDYLGGLFDGTTGIAGSTDPQAKRKATQHRTGTKPVTIWDALSPFHVVSIMMDAASFVPAKRPMKVREGARGGSFSRLDHLPTVVPGGVQTLITVGRARWSLPSPPKHRGPSSRSQGPHVHKGWKITTR